MTNKKTIAIIEQSGGCDYTIGCGILVLEHNPSEKTLEEWVTNIMENYPMNTMYGYSVVFYLTTELEPEIRQQVKVWGLKA